MAKKKIKFNHDAKMIVTNENPKKIPLDLLSPGFRFVEVEITNRVGIKSRVVVALHKDQILNHKK